jgi:uncharacterized protein YrzB (UPF0473 family)
MSHDREELPEEMFCDLHGFAFELIDVMELVDEDGAKELVGIVLVAEIDGQDYALCAAMKDEETVQHDEDGAMVLFVMRIDSQKEGDEVRHFYTGIGNTLHATYVLRCMQNLVQGYDEGENAKPDDEETT